MDEIGYHHKHTPDFVIDRPNGAGDWLFLIMETPSVFRIGGTERKIPKNSFIIFTPDFPQYYRADGCEYCDDWMHFGPDDTELALMQELEIPLNTPVTLSDVADISAMIRNMCYEQYSANLHRTEAVDLYFRLLIYKLHEKTAAQADATKVSEQMYFEKLMWIRESIYRWPGRNYTIDDMAKELSLSRSRFQHLYSETFGISISQDLIKSRMDKAAELLKSTDLSVKDIGCLIGYPNTAYLIKLFGKTFGITPVQYRKRETTKQDEADLPAD